MNTFIIKLSENYELNLLGHIVRGSGGEIYPLTMIEHRILLVLIDHTGEVVSSNTLTDIVWGTDADTYALQCLNSAVCRLRAKLPVFKEVITTFRGAGYKFEPVI